MTLAVSQMTSSAETQLETQSACVRSLCSGPWGPQTSLTSRPLPSRGEEAGDTHLTNTQQHLHRLHTVTRQLAHILDIFVKMKYKYMWGRS